MFYQYTPCPDVGLVPQDFYHHQCHFCRYNIFTAVLDSDLSSKQCSNCTHIGQGCDLCGSSESYCIPTLICWSCGAERVGNVVPIVNISKCVFFFFVLFILPKFSISRCEQCGYPVDESWLIKWAAETGG